jgi:hypothetical protein
MACANAPSGPRRAPGVCHVCAMKEGLPVFLAIFIGDKGRVVQEVSFCGGCCHWFCSDCRKNVFGRVTGFVKHYVSPSPNCCGPQSEES